VTLKTLVTGMAAAVMVAGAGGRCDFRCISPPCRPPRPFNRSCGTSRCRRHRRQTYSLHSCRRCRPSPGAARSAVRRPSSRAVSAGSKASPPTGPTTGRQQRGKFPLTFNVANIDQEGGVANADVTATSALGTTATETVQFVAGPSPSGWQISKQSALSLLSAAGCPTACIARLPQSWAPSR